MSKAKVGTGELKPFKKGSTGSESIGGSTNKEHVREGMYPNVQINTASRNVTELTPFKTGPTGPGTNTGNPSVPAFRKMDSCGIPYDEYKPFKE